MSKTPSTTLTAREEQVLQHLILGLTAKEIGTAMGLSAHTVRTHVHNIHVKFGVRTTSRVVALYISQHPTKGAL